jgi:TRAP-type mannitol/chloroaromatic compound transport system permease large subunit
MTDPALGLLMLALIVVVIMLGFPTAFTLMGLGMMFGFVAFYDPSQSWTANKVFTLMVQRTYGGMTNDVLLSIPLFVLMGYVMERSALVDKMFHSIQLAFRRLPASLAVATLVVCTFWGIASGLVGAVVVLMGVIALKPMLNAGYDVKLASGVITAGGTLGILIPPSVMIIVYAAVAGQSVVKLYAAAMLPGFFLSFLYLVYIIGWALINPKIAPKLPPEQQIVPIPPSFTNLQAVYSKNMLVALIKALLSPSKAFNAADTAARMTYGAIVRATLAALFPLMLAIATLWGTWWYVVIHQQAEADAVKAATTIAAPAAVQAAEPTAPVEEKLQEMGSGGTEATTTAAKEEPLQEMGTDLKTPGLVHIDAPADAGPPAQFYNWFWGITIFTGLLLFWYYARLGTEQLEILKLLVESVMPLGILTLVVLAVILLGITTATESAAVGALGALYMAGYNKYAKIVLWSSLVLGIIGAVAAYFYGGPSTGAATHIVIIAFLLCGVVGGTIVVWAYDLATKRKMKKSLNEAVFLTAKTTAMVCWLFVGSALFSAVFAILGGQSIIEKWVLSMNLTPLQFMLLSQAIIFVLGWPLEWTEIIVIFVPIFLPLLGHFQIDPILWGTLVFVNLQAAFLSPPVAMSAFYLKGVAPSHVTINQIFAGMMPYMLIVIVCMVIMYIWPGMTLWLPNYLYGA